MKQHITVGGIAIKTPPSFRIERYSLTKSGRTASGKMTMELIAKKRKLICVWPAMDAHDMNSILDLVWEASNMFLTIGYVENNVTKSCICYMGDIDTDLYRTDPSNWVWKDVELHFIEQ